MYCHQAEGQGNQVYGRGRPSEAHVVASVAAPYREEPKDEGVRLWPQLASSAFEFARPEACRRVVRAFHKRCTEEESSTRIVLTTVAVGRTIPEIASALIASALIASGAEGPPAVLAAAFSGAAAQRASAAVQAQHV